MQRQLFSHFCRGMLLLLPAIFLNACTGGASKPPRKKMPELTNLNSQLDISYGMQSDGGFNFPVRTGYVDLMLNGKITSFMAVNFPDDNVDSLALSLANSYKPLAQAMLAQWAQQQGTGILIDLRHTAKQESIRSDYTIENGSFSIPVIVVYDPVSASRASTFINLLQSIPAVQCLQTGGSRFGKDDSRQDCFAGY